VRPQPAERSEVVELGAKWLLMDGDLAMRAALYQATKDWERNGDLESTAAILTKKRRTKGFELEAAGRISERWEVFSGLALMDARILEPWRRTSTPPPAPSPSPMRATSASRRATRRRGPSTCGPPTS
jgi:outer membrane receptor for monomeric catechols